MTDVCVDTMEAHGWSAGVTAEWNPQQNGWVVARDSAVTVRVVFKITFAFRLPLAPSGPWPPGHGLYRGVV